MTAHNSLLLVMNQSQSNFVRDVSSLSILNDPSPHHTAMSSEYVRMILSYLRVLFKMTGE